MKPSEGRQFWTPSVAVAGNDVIIATASHAIDNSLLGSYLFINDEVQAPFTGEDKKTELLLVVVK